MGTQLTHQRMGSKNLSVTDRFHGWRSRRGHAAAVGGTPWDPPDHAVRACRGGLGLGNRSGHGRTSLIRGFQTQALAHLGGAENERGGVRFARRPSGGSEREHAPA